MGSNPRPQDFASRFIDLERRVATMERASRLNSASIGSGGLTIRRGGNLVFENGGGIEINDGGDIQINDGGGVEIADGGDLSVTGGVIRVGTGGDIVLFDGNISNNLGNSVEVWRASEDPLVPRSSFVYSPLMSHPTTPTDHFADPIPVPLGYRSGNLLMMVLANDAFATTGWVSVQAIVKFTRASGSSYITQGAGEGAFWDEVVNAKSFWATEFEIDPNESDPVDSLSLGVRVNRGQAELNATSGAWGLSGQIIFRRGGLQ